jgi:hypothetical protein
MKVIFASVLIAILIAVAAGFILNSLQRPAYEAYSTSSTRVNEPGHNLVGANWSGDPATPGKS